MGERIPYPLIRRPFDQSDARLSPDGRWVAYVSNASGRQEVLLRPFAPSSNEDATGAGASVVVSTGISPRRRKDGRELFLTTPAGAVLAVPVTMGSGSTVKIGSPHLLFHAPGMVDDWAVSADGQRFLLAGSPRPGAMTRPGVPGPDEVRRLSAAGSALAGQLHDLTHLTRDVHEPERTLSRAAALARDANQHRDALHLFLGPAMIADAAEAIAIP